MGYVKRILRNGVIGWIDPDRLYTHREDLPTYIDRNGVTSWFLDGSPARLDRRMAPTLFPSGRQSDEVSIPGER